MMGSSSSSDLAQRTRYLHTFESREQVTAWLLARGIYHPKQELDRIWDRFITQGRDYHMVIHGKKGQKPWLTFYRIKPRCAVCGQPLPKTTTPIDWGPGKPVNWYCSEHQPKEANES